MITERQLAAILRVNAHDADKDLSLAECVKRFEKTPEQFQGTWLRKARKYLAEVKDEAK